MLGFSQFCHEIKIMRRVGNLHGFTETELRDISRIHYQFSFVAGSIPPRGERQRRPCVGSACLR